MQIRRIYHHFEGVRGRRSVMKLAASLHGLQAVCWLSGIVTNIFLFQYSTPNGEENPPSPNTHVYSTLPTAHPTFSTWWRPWDTLEGHIPNTPQGKHVVFAPTRSNQQHARVRQAAAMRIKTTIAVATCYAWMATPLFTILYWQISVSICKLQSLSLRLLHTTHTNEAQNVDDVDELSSFRPIITVNNKNKHSLAIILHSKNAHTENND